MPKQTCELSVVRVKTFEGNKSIWIERFIGSLVGKGRKISKGKEERERESSGVVMMGSMERKGGRAACFLHPAV